MLNVHFAMRALANNGLRSRCQLSIAAAGRSSPPDAGYFPRHDIFRKYGADPPSSCVLSVDMSYSLKS